MCLILFAYRVHPRYRLILAANRDEYYNRPTAAAGFWPDHPTVLGGRDLQNMGTWLGITKTGRFAALTNYRDPRLVVPDALSRGELVKNFLICGESPDLYLQHVQEAQHLYNGFNLLVGDHNSLWYYGKHAGRAQEISPGIYGLSNHLLNTPWPKVMKGVAQLQRLLQVGELAGNASHEQKIDPAGLFGLLSDRSPAADNDLPATGVSREWERILSPIFITSPEYGTRCSTVVLVGEDGEVDFTERTYQPFDRTHADPSCSPDGRESVGDSSFYFRIPLHNR